MAAPVEVRSATGEVATRAARASPSAAPSRSWRALADQLAVVRSFVPGDGNHDIKPVVGRDTFGANLGSIYARVAGMNHPVTRPADQRRCSSREPVDPTTQPGTTAFGNFDATGRSAPACAPFAPGGGGSLQQDMKLSCRWTASTTAGACWPSSTAPARASTPPSATASTATRDQAFRILLGGVGDAFDLSKEDPKTVARYDTAPLVRPENIDKKWNNYNNYVDNAKSLGKLLLLARRLCERGCGFVTVTTNFVWDMHADVNNAPVAEGMRYMGPPLDHAVSAFLEDLEARGLSDKILLVVLRRDGPDAADQQERRPRPLGQPRPAAAGRRRPEDGPGHRPVGSPTAASRPRPGAHQEPDRHDHAHAVRRGPAARHARPAARAGPRP